MSDDLEIILVPAVLVVLVALYVFKACTGQL